MDSPVPASMFAPEPSSPGAARAAAAAARLHGGFDSDCSEDGEALNGEPELDLTSKVGPGAGGGAEGRGAKRSGRAAGRLRGKAGAGVSRPPAGAGREGGLPGDGRPPHRVLPRRRRPGRPPPAGRLPPRSQPSAPPRGTGAPTPAAPPAPSPSVALSLDWPLQAAERRRRLGQGARRREGQVVRGGAGQPRPSWCREGKQQVVAPSGRRLSEECLGIYKSTQNRSGRWHDP